MIVETYDSIDNHIMMPTKQQQTTNTPHNFNRSALLHQATILRDFSLELCAILVHGQVSAHVQTCVHDLLNMFDPLSSKKWLQWQKIGKMYSFLVSQFYSSFCGHWRIYRFNTTAINTEICGSIMTSSPPVKATPLISE